MDDPASTKNLRSKEKTQFLIEGMMDSTQTTPEGSTVPQKRIDIPCLVALVNSTEGLDNFALVIITKKNKKIDSILPLTSELQIQDLDSFNFICYWDPMSYDQIMPIGS